MSPVIPSRVAAAMLLLIAGSAWPTEPPLPAPPAAPAVPAERLTGGCPCEVGDGGTQFAIDLMLGMQTGVRVQAAAYRTETAAFVAEGYYGLLANKIAGGEGAGFGGRYYWRRTDRAGDNSVLFGPGAGVYYHFRDEVFMLAPTMEVAWVRPIGDNGAWQIGINGGIGIGLSGRYPDDQGKVTPLISLFTGFRF